MIDEMLQMANSYVDAEEVDQHHKEEVSWAPWTNRLARHDDDRHDDQCLDVHDHHRHDCEHRSDKRNHRDRPEGSRQGQLRHH